MRRAAAAVTIALALIVSAPVRADDQLLRADDQLLYTYFTDFIDALRTQAGIPGLAAAIVKLDESVWDYYWGQQDVEHALTVRRETPFQFDGLTQIATASLVLQCVDEGRVSLDDRIRQFKPDSPDADATIRQVLTHTFGPPDNLTFVYRPQRYEPLADVVAKCRGASYRETVQNELLDRFAMTDSVPGPDAGSLVPSLEGFPTPKLVAQYADVLKNLATPYAVSSQRKASPSQYTTTTLTAFSGLISTVWDLAKFDLALRDGAIVGHDLLADAWRAPVDQSGRALPHAQGWFVQTYNGKTVVWQIGASENASSSMIVKVPSLGTTLILAANSDGLVKPFPLSAGDVTVSPFARVFLAIFAR